MGSVERQPDGERGYPRNTREFAAWFRDEASCQAHLEGLRWPDGFECPHCGGRVGWRVASGAFLCRGCRRRTSVRTGTIFESSHLPLETWFWAAWAVTSSKRGVSALGLQRELGLPSYQTTWRLLHKLRRAMVRPDRDQLAGVVEVDETYVGGVEVGVTGRETHTKSIVVVAVEVINDRSAGRIRLATVPNVGAAGLRPFVERAVAPGSEIRTDAWPAYNLPRPPDPRRQ